MTPAFRQRLIIHAASLSVIALLGACSAKNLPAQKAFLNLSVAPGSKAGAFSTLSLNDDYCYAVMVSAPSPAQLNRHTFNRSGCAEANQFPQYLGMTSSLVPLGGNVKLSVPVGAARRIDLFGFKKVPTKAGAQSPPASCEGSFEVQPSGNTTDGDTATFIGGVKVNLETRLIATKTMSLNPGVQDVALDLLSDENGISTDCGAPTPVLVSPTSASLSTADGRALVVSYVDTISPTTATVSSAQTASGSGYGFIAGSTVSGSIANSLNNPVNNAIAYSGTSEDPGDLSREFQIDMGQFPLNSYDPANPPGCIFESPNSASFNCAIGRTSLFYDSLKNVFGGGLRFSVGSLLSNFLPVKKYVIRKALDINGSSSSDSITRMMSFDDSLYFEAFLGGATRFLRFNPLSPNSVQRIIAENSNDYISQATLHSGKIFFGGATSSGYAAGFHYDPLNNALTRFTNTTGGLNDFATYFASDGSGLLYFAANAGSQGVRLMVFDGSSITRLSFISDSGVMGGDEPRDIQVHDSRIYFSAQNNAYGVRKLFAYDPGANSITPISNTSGNTSTTDDPRSLTWANDKLYFIANNSNGVSKLFAFTPADDTVTQITDHATSANSDFDPNAKLIVFDGALYFPMFDVSNASKLYRYSFQDGNLQQVSNTNGAGSDLVGEKMASYGGALYFTAYKNATICSLYRYNPVQNKTERLANPAGTNMYSCPTELTSHYDGLYFVARNATYIDKLYRLTEE
jgi:hypothetical protein